MRRYGWFISLGVFIMLILMAAPIFPQGPETPEAILGVDAFMRQVERYPGTVRVKGVVSAISEKDQTLALIDTQEFQECGVVTCAGLQLPVRWEGALPAVGDLVIITGQVEKVGGKRLFAAKSLGAAAPQPKAPK